MANHQVPRTGTQRVEVIHGIDDDRNVITAVVFRHVRRGHAEPEFYLVQYRERARRIERGSRVTRQYSGPRAAVRLEADLAEVRDLLAESRAREAQRAA
jgi:hypothetical protein